MSDLNDLQKYIDSLPEPKTPREKLLVWWSNLLDWVGSRRKHEQYSCRRSRKCCRYYESYK